MAANGRITLAALDLGLGPWPTCVCGRTYLSGTCALCGVWLFRLLSAPCGAASTRQPYLNLPVIVAVSAAAGSAAAATVGHNHRVIRSNKKHVQCGSVNDVRVDAGMTPAADRNVAMLVSACRGLCHWLGVIGMCLLDVTASLQAGRQEECIPQCSLLSE